MQAAERPSTQGLLLAGRVQGGHCYHRLDLEICYLAGRCAAVRQRPVDTQLNTQLEGCHGNPAALCLVPPHYVQWSHSGEVDTMESFESPASWI